MAISKNEVQLYGSETAIVEQKRGNYEIQGVMGGKSTTLVRDVDFMKIPKTKTPSLTKSGAEKIARAYGVFQRYTIEDKQIVNDPPSYSFIVRCDLVKINPVDGKEWVVANGYGGGSTNEKRNGFAGCYDSLNSTIKMCSKRALVAAAINLGGYSSLFTQDIENENFMAQSDKLTQNEGDSASITSKQVKRIFALAAQAGYSVEEAKTKLQAEGFASTKDITIGQYDKVCELFKEKK